MKEKLKRGVIGFIILAALIVVPYTIANASARYYVLYLLDVWSVDSGKHLDWNGNTNYMSNWNTGVQTWNNYKSGVIRKDGAFTINDVTISDVNSLTANTVALTNQTYRNPGKSISATVQFSKTEMDKLSTVKKNIACSHEIGHLLGLDENKNDGTNLIMFNIIAYNTSNNVLHNIDKFHYDYMYNNKY